MQFGSLSGTLSLFSRKQIFSLQYCLQCKQVSSQALLQQLRTQLDHILSEISKSEFWFLKSDFLSFSIENDTETNHKRKQSFLLWRQMSKSEFLGFQYDFLWKSYCDPKKTLFSLCREVVFGCFAVEMIRQTLTKENVVFFCAWKVNFRVSSTISYGNRTVTQRKLCFLCAEKWFLAVLQWKWYGKPSQKKT